MTVGSWPSEIELTPLTSLEAGGALKRHPKKDATVSFDYSRR